LVGIVSIILIGLNHKTASIVVREIFALEFEMLPKMLAWAHNLSGVQEFFLISTCNRLEILVVAEDSLVATKVLARWLCEGRALNPKLIMGSLYRYIDEDAVRHLFRVASSLDSMVIGESQILGQIKEAYRIASQVGTTGIILNRLLHKTFQVAKRVRSETVIGGAAVSLSYAAVELARKIFDNLIGLKALLIGAGEMARLAAEHLLAQGIHEVLVANRTLASAVDLAGRLSRGRRLGGAFNLDDLPQVLSDVDIIVSSTSSLEPIITYSLVRRVLKVRQGRPLFFIDIAVPRDIDPTIGNLAGCFLYDIDDLVHVVEANRASRATEAQAAEVIVAEEVVKFSIWLKSLAVAPTIVKLTAKAEAIRIVEMVRVKKELSDLSQRELNVIDHFTRSFIKKLLHDPILFLRDQIYRGEESQRSHTALVRRLFKLSENG